ncbi:MAG: hypothetical protein ABIK73_07240 [candidate division WOR-3 bacterium]
MELLGIDISYVNTMLLVVLSSLVILAASLSVYFFAGKIHPKVKFLVFSKTGAHTRSYRLYYGKYPTDLDIISILIGKKSTGFPITLFNYEFLNGKKYYLAQYYEGRLFPTDMANKLGYGDIIVKYCPKCETSDISLEPLSNCPKCKSKLDLRSEKILNVKLHELKFAPELEKRCVFKPDLANDTLIPLQEWLAMYDIGQKIAEEMERSENEAKEMIDKNPFMTVLIATLPLAIILAGFSLAIYLMFMGLGGEFSRGSELLKEAALILKELKGSA